MRRCFVDTGAFVAREIAADQHHPVAGRSWREVEECGHVLVSSEHVFDESATLIWPGERLRRPPRIASVLTDAVH